MFAKLKGITIIMLIGLFLLGATFSGCIEPANTDGTQNGSMQEQPPMDQF